MNIELMLFDFLNKQPLIPIYILKIKLTFHNLICMHTNTHTHIQSYMSVLNLSELVIQPKKSKQRKTFKIV